MIEVLRELHRIAERRDGAIFKMEYVEDRWITEKELENPPVDHQWIVKSSSFQGQTVRGRS